MKTLNRWLLALGWLGLPCPSLGATYLVTTTGDSIHGECAAVCSLRDAIITANNNPGNDKIELPAGIYHLTRSAPGPDSTTGDLDVNSAIDVVGAGAFGTRIVSNGTDRVFEILNGNLRLDDLSVSGGDAAAANGGGILVNTNGILVTNRCEIRENRAKNGGGVFIVPSGTAVIQKSVLRQNAASAGGSGGAISNSGDLLLSQTEVTGNVSSAWGGGIANQGGMALLESLVSYNQASGAGGGLDNRAADPMQVISSTFSGNRSGNDFGSAIYNQATPLVLNNVTLAFNGNKALFSSNAAVQIRNSLLGHNGTANCAKAGSGSLVSLGNNIDSGNTCGLGAASDRSNTDPRIMELADNGGLTQTHALIAAAPGIPGSPAINAGNNATCAKTDQRRSARPVGAACDIGAFESAALRDDGALVKLNFEAPSGDLSGIRTTRGWALSDNDIRAIALFVDGVYQGDVPAKALRRDVERAFPEAYDPRHSGFSRADNYNIQSDGTHRVTARAIDRQGLFRDVARTVNVSRFGGAAFIPPSTPVNLGGAVPSIVAGEISLQGVLIDGVSYEVNLLWNSATQDFDIVDILGGP